MIWILLLVFYNGNSYIAIKEIGFENKLLCEKARVKLIKPKKKIAWFRKVTGDCFQTKTK